MPYAANPNDRAKAAVLVAAIHVGLGAALMFGLAGDKVRRAVETLKSFDVVVPAQPVREPPPPVVEEAGTKDEPAPPNLRSLPAPVVAPEPPIPLPVPSPVRTAEIRAPVEGVDPTAGAAAVAGPGTGAGGSGSGFGGGGSGGSGAGSGSSGGLGAEARLLSGNLTRRDYRRIRGYGSPRGQAVLAIGVGPEGRLVGCTPLQSSGNPALDDELCGLLGRTRWAPATDRAGRPVTVQLRYVATWDRN